MDKSLRWIRNRAGRLDSSVRYICTHQEEGFVQIWAISRLWCCSGLDWGNKLFLCFSNPPCGNERASDIHLLNLKSSLKSCYCLLLLQPETYKCVICDRPCFASGTKVSSLIKIKEMSAVSTTTHFFDFFPIFRRRRTKLQAHLKESRSLKNYALNAHNALEAKMRASDINMPMQEVKLDFFISSAALQSSIFKRPIFFMTRKSFGVYNIIMR